MKTLKKQPTYRELQEIEKEVLRTGETVIIDTATQYTKIYRVENKPEHGGNYVTSRSIVLKTRQGRRTWVSLQDGEGYGSSKKEAKELAGV